jgi:hypothetical protein
MDFFKSKRQRYLSKLVRVHSNHFKIKYHVVLNKEQIGYLKHYLIGEGDRRYQADKYSKDFTVSRVFDTIYHSNRSLFSEASGANINLMLACLTQYSEEIIQTYLEALQSKDIASDDVLLNSLQAAQKRDKTRGIQLLQLLTTLANVSISLNDISSDALETLEILQEKDLLPANRILEYVRIINTFDKRLANYFLSLLTILAHFAMTTVEIESALTLKKSPNKIPLVLNLIIQISNQHDKREAQINVLLNFSKICAQAEDMFPYADKIIAMLFNTHLLSHFLIGRRRAAQVFCHTRLDKVYAVLLYLSNARLLTSGNFDRIFSRLCTDIAQGWHTALTHFENQLKALKAPLTQDSLNQIMQEQVRFLGTQNTANETRKRVENPILKASLPQQAKPSLLQAPKKTRQERILQGAHHKKAPLNQRHPHRNPISDSPSLQAKQTGTTFLPLNYIPGSEKISSASKFKSLNDKDIVSLYQQAQAQFEPPVPSLPKPSMA